MHTNLRHLKTDRPSTSSKDKSRRLAETIMRSKIFQPQLKKSLLKAISFSVHSKVNIDVNTWKYKYYHHFLELLVVTTKKQCVRKKQLTLLPISNALFTFWLIPWCSIAKKHVLSNIQIVIKSSKRGSLTILYKEFWILSHPW